LNQDCTCPAQQGHQGFGQTPLLEPPAARPASWQVRERITACSRLLITRQERRAQPVNLLLTINPAQIAR
jgi:hypothetical protein